MSIVEVAKKIATKAHKGQTRWDKKTPYISHPAAVAKACADAGYSEKVQAVAWLHDVIEDCNMHAFELIDAGITDPEVIDGVIDITKYPDDNYLEYILRVRDNEIARLVKIEDIKHNLNDLRKGSMRQKYELALYILEESF